MKIECILHRDGGTRVQLGGTEYHFVPLDDGAHVADVENTDHQDRFLAISEAYRLYRASSATSAEEIGATGMGEGNSEPTVPVILLGSNVHPASFDIGGKTYSLGDIVALAAEGFSPADWNELSDEARADLIDEKLDELDVQGEGEADTVLADLREQYKAKFGRLPHPTMKAESIQAKLAE